MGAIPAARLYHTNYRELPPPTPREEISSQTARKSCCFCLFVSFVVLSRI